MFCEFAFRFGGNAGGSLEAVLCVVLEEEERREIVLEVFYGFWLAGCRWGLLGLAWLASLREREQ